MIDRGISGQFCKAIRIDAYARSVQMTRGPLAAAPSIEVPAAPAPPCPIYSVITENSIVVRGEPA